MNGRAGLILEGVSAGYGDTVVLEGISLALAPGETLAVLGRNGVGKTTLLATIMGHTRLHGGGIRFAGREIADHSYNISRARLGSERDSRYLSTKERCCGAACANCHVRRFDECWSS